MERKSEEGISLFVRDERTGRLLLNAKAASTSICTWPRGVLKASTVGDRSVESLEVEVPEGWAFQSDPYRGASDLAGCSGSEPVKPRNLPPA